MYQLNEIIQTKKNHVCGSFSWKVIRTGADLKLECQGCSRVILISKRELDKKIKVKRVENN